jgi:sulfatase modifying factor 1
MPPALLNSESAREPRLLAGAIAIDKKSPRLTIFRHGVLKAKTSWSDSGMSGGANTCCLPVGSRSEAVEPVRNFEPRPFSSEGMKLLSGGRFLMGSKGTEIWAADGEGPVREVTLQPYWIDETVVTNADFAGFIEATGYVTEAENFGWSFVHASQLSEGERRKRNEFRVAGLEWWYRVDGSNWRQPVVPGVCFREMKREAHPAVHLSWNDAAAYAQWRGKRLPTEAEWEYACRGGLVQQTYPWGNDLTPAGKHRCNIWQGEFPKTDRGEDGYRGTAPARSFKPNGYGLFNMTGNVWEWVGDWFDPNYGLYGDRVDPKGPVMGTARVMRGGSYLCHASYCNRYRCSARTSNTPDTSSGHLGFRCAGDLGKEEKSGVAGHIEARP